MTVTVGQAAPTEHQKQELRNAFDIAGLDAQNRLVGPGGAVLDVGAVASGDNRQRLNTETLRIATFGDSTSNLGEATCDIRVVDVAVPASGSAFVSTRLSKMALPLLYPNTQIVANGGVSGETTTQMLARDFATASATRKSITDVQDTQPHVILYRGGSINDISSVDPAGVPERVAQVYGRHVDVISRLLRTGAFVIDEGIAGYSGSHTYPDAVRACLVQLNDLFRAYAATTGGDVHFLDPVGLTCDAAGNMLSGVSLDGVHQTVFGQLTRIAAAEAAVIKARFGRSASQRYQGVNLLGPGALMNTTSSISYGLIATGYSANATNATRQNAKVELVGGVLYQTCEFVPSSTTNSGTIVLPGLSTIAYAQGDVLGVEMDILIQSLDGSTVTFDASAARFIAAQTGQGQTFVDVLQSSSDVFKVDGSMKLHAPYLPFKINVPPASINAASSTWSLMMSNADKPFKLGVGNARIVKLA